MMRFVPRDEGAEMSAELVVLIGGDVMKFIDGDQPVVERLDAHFIDREAEGRVGANQYRVGAGQEFADRLHLDLATCRVVHPGRVAEVPLRLHRPIGPEAELRKRFVGEAAADRPLRARR